MCIILVPGTLHRFTCQSSYRVREVPGYFNLIQDNFYRYLTTILLYFSNHWCYLLQPLLSFFLFFLNVYPSPRVHHCVNNERSIFYLYNKFEMSSVEIIRKL